MTEGGRWCKEEGLAKRRWRGAGKHPATGPPLTDGNSADITLPSNNGKRHRTDTGCSLTFWGRAGSDAYMLTAHRSRERKERQLTGQFLKVAVPRRRVPQRRVTLIPRIYSNSYRIVIKSNCIGAGLVESKLNIVAITDISIPPIPIIYLTSHRTDG